ncbi:MAG: hypothetical protein WD226_13645 [Planctomycetota bacterium]
MELLNLVKGQRIGSQGSGRFRLFGAHAPFPALGSAPRSGVADTELALERLGCRTEPASERMERLEDVAAALRRGLPAATSAQAARLGHAVAPADSLEPELNRLDELAFRLERDGVRASEITWCAVPWCDPPARVFERVARALLTSHAVVVASDERGPFLAEALANALVASGWCSDSVALLHAPTDEAVVSAFELGATRLVGRADRGRVARWKRVVERIAVDVPRARPRAVTCDDVHRAGGVERLAERLVGEALDDLGGQAHGTLGALHVEPAVFGPFEEVFVAAFERRASTPGPLIDGEACAAFRARLLGGLDEGATLVAGSVMDEPAVRRRRTLAPALFTNVEARGRLVRDDRPLPIATLVRANSDLRP